MLEFLFCPTHGIITQGWPVLLAFGAVARVYAHKVIALMARWF